MVDGEDRTPWIRRRGGVWIPVVVVTVCGLIGVAVAVAPNEWKPHWPGNDPSKTVSATPSASPTAGAASQVFEGDGAIDTVETDAVELYGTYLVEWEISDNEQVSDGTPALFTALMQGGETGDVQPTLEVRDDLVEGSGKEEITVHKLGSYRVSIEASPSSHWKLTFTRSWS